MSKKSWLQQSHLVPITFGITGHRDIVKEDAQRASACIERTIKSYRTRFPLTPFLFISPLAQGADCIAAQAALNADENTFLQVALPFNLESYKETIENDWHPSFNNLFSHDRCINVFTLNNQTNLSESDKDSAYKKIGEFVAIHSHVLFTLKNADPPEKKGGTAEIVEFRKRGCVNLDEVSNTNIRCAEEGFLYEIRVRREKDAHLPTPTEKDDICLITPQINHQEKSNKAKFALGVEKPKAVKKLLPTILKLFKQAADSDSTAEQIENLNQISNQKFSEFQRLANNPSTAPEKNWSTEGLYEIKDFSEKPISNQSLNHHTRHVKSITDNLASLFQKKYFTYLNMMFWFGALAGLFESFEEVIEGHIHFLHDHTYLKYIFVAIVMLIYGFIKIKAYKNTYESYRGLSEALRIQDYWFKGGVNQSTTDHFLSTEIGNNSWVRRALRSLWLMDFSKLQEKTKLSPQSYQALNLLNKEWIEDQKKYLDKKIHEFHHINTLLENVFKGFLALGGLLLVIGTGFVSEYFEINEDLTEIIKSTGKASLILGGLVKGYIELHAYEVFIKRFESSKHVYSQSSNIFKHFTETLDENAAQPPLRGLYQTLGESVLDEVSDWYIANTRLELKAPGAG